jgi:hypothetical protein
LVIQILDQLKLIQVQVKSVSLDAFYVCNNLVNSTFLDNYYLSFISDDKFNKSSFLNGYIYQIFIKQTTKNNLFISSDIIKNYEYLV